MIDLLLRTTDAGRLVGVIPLSDKFALFIGDHGRFELRYLYDSADAARMACAVWEGYGAPPGPCVPVRGTLGAMHVYGAEAIQ